MVMRKIRQSKKTMRLPLIIMTIVLAFGLVGSFAIWSSPNVDTPSAQNEPTAEEQIKNLQLSIDTWEESLKQTPKDFGLLKSLADVRYEQGQLYVQNGNNDKAKEVFAKSLENYLSALDNAPRELNNKGKADIMVNAAGAASSAGQDSTANAFYQEAVKLVPDDFTTRYNYILYLALQKQDFDLANKELDSYRASLPTGDSRIADVDKLKKGLEEIKKAAKTPAAQEQKEEKK